MIYKSAGPVELKVDTSKRTVEAIVFFVQVVPYDGCPVIEQKHVGLKEPEAGSIGSLEGLPGVCIPLTVHRP